MAARNATSILGSIRIFGNKTVICQDPFKIHSRGVWFGDDPLFFSAPLLILQLSLVFMSTRMAAFFLKPLGQPMIVSQIIGGIILGPSILGRNKAFTAKIFPSRGTMVLDTVGWFGLILFLFLEGVKMDVTSVKQSGRKAMAIGISAFFIPLVVASIMSIILIKFLPMEPSLARALPYIAIGECLMPFVVVSCLLTELRILNTELGRLAITSSMYGEVSGITMSMVSFASSQNNGTHILSSLRGILASIAMIAFIGVVFRPAVLWLSKQTPEGKSVPELHIFAVTVSVLVAAFVSITIGQNMVLGPLVLGLAVPDGPPMGSALVERLDSLISGMFFPIFFAISGLRTNLFAIQAKATWIVGFIVTITCVARAAAVMLPSLFYNIPMRDAVVLGLMLNSKGIIQMISYNLMNETKILNEQEYALLVLSVIFITGIAAPLLRSLYNPSQKYVSAKRRTIQHAKHGELRILVCIHSQDNVPTMLNLLEISHASKDSPISVLLLNLFELVGRASPILIAHQFTSNTRSSSSSSSSRSDKTINAFRHYELHNQGSVTVQPFTAISHVATMHDDVCQLALDRKTTIIIVPFHKQWAIDGTIGSVNPGIRAMNRNILDKAPCSVGILVDRGIQSGSSSVITSRSVLYRVTVLFMGGPDDGEALAYGERMSQQHNVKLTVIRFQAFGSDSQDIESDENLDDEVISEFKLNSEVNELSEYREEVVRDGEELVTVIRGLLKDGNDLTIVGRHHGKNSSLLTGFNEWSECPELGIIGDILASPDFGITSSVLVVQQ